MVRVRWHLCSNPFVVLVLLCLKVCFSLCLIIRFSNLLLIVLPRIRRICINEWMNGTLSVNGADFLSRFSHASVRQCNFDWGLNRD